MNQKEITVNDIVLVYRNLGNPIFDINIGRIATVTHVLRNAQGISGAFYDVAYHLDDNEIYLFFKEELLKITPPPFESLITNDEEIQDLI